MIRVTIWNEFEEEKMYEEVKKIYPDGIHVFQIFFPKMRICRSDV